MPVDAPQRALDLGRVDDLVTDVDERATREGSIARIDPWEAAGIVIGAATGIILLSMGGVQTVFSKEALESLVEKAVRILWDGLRVKERAAGTAPHN